MQNANLMEKLNLKLVNGLVDLNAAAVTGGRVSVKKGDRLSLIIAVGSSTSAVATFTLNQHTAASGGSSKVLAIANPYFHKHGSATVFTKVEPSSAASSYDFASLIGDDAGLIVLEILAEDLDTNNGYAWVSIDSADSTAAKLGCVLAVCHNVQNSAPYDQAI